MNDQKKLVQILPDLSNNPSYLVLGGIKLPEDAICYLSSKKVVVVDQILDGVAVTEKIMRKPSELEFQFILRSYTDVGQVNSDLTCYIFPQKKMEEIWQNVFLPDSVLKVENTYINGLGIFEVIVTDITPVTFRGSKNIQLSIKSYENIPGQTLIIS